MSRCIEKLPHSCGSSDGLQVFGSDRGSYNGFCFSCGTYVHNPYGEGKPPSRPAKPKKTKEEISEEIEEISSLKTFALEDRQLTKEALEYFGVKIGLSEYDGNTQLFHYYPYYGNGGLLAYKTRFVPSKGMWWVGSSRNVRLFGWDQALGSGSKTLFITEGELDAVALYQALKSKQRGTKWEHLTPAVVSLINGSGGAKQDITTYLSAIRANFRDVVLVFDQDDAGQAATHAVMQVLPTARSVTLPAKDANQCVIEGRSVALANAVLFKGQTPKNTRLVWAGSLYEASRQAPQWGLSWPWQGMTEITRGLRTGETYYIGAGVKMGKSEIVNTLATSLIVSNGMKVFLAKPEETNIKTVKLLCGKIAGKFFHDPKVEFDYDAYDKAYPIIRDNVCLLDLYQHVDWSSLRTDILVAAAEGCKAVFIDPITNLTNGVSSGETNTILQEIAQELSAIAKDLDIIVFIFCHLKSPEGGPSHERGGKVLSHQFAGSRAMMRSCNYMIGLEGNKDPDLPTEQRNLRRLIILEDREFGEGGVVDLYWDNNTSLFNEVYKR